MRYAFLFLFLGAGLLAVAFRTGSFAWILLWPAISALVIAAGYAWLGARVFGKARDGRFAWWSLILHWPYLLSTLGVWYSIRWAIFENCADEISPGIWLSRRPLGLEIPAGITTVVDLTAEFWVATGVRNGHDYICFPTLDGHVCDDAAFVAMVREVAQLPGTILIHCAQGHGRSAALAIGILLARGIIDDLKDAESRLIALRPKIGLKKSQRAMLERATGGLVSINTQYH